MEAVIFVGIQASGKSRFYRERFFTTHVRINLDLLRMRRRERSLLAWCLDHCMSMCHTPQTPCMSKACQ